MHTAWRAFLVLVVAVCVCRADEPAGETAAVLASFRAYNDAMMNLDEAGMRAINNETNDLQRRFSQAMITGDLAVAKLKLAAKEKFGDDAARMVGKTIGDISNDDLAEATVRIEGDRAMVVVGSGGIPMVKADGKWKFDLSAANTEEGVNRNVAAYRQRAEKTSALAAEVAEGKFQNIEALLAAIGERGL